jgi:hypothetical protein
MLGRQFDNEVTMPGHCRTGRNQARILSAGNLADPAFDVAILHSADRNDIDAHQAGNRLNNCELTDPGSHRRVPEDTCPKN